MVELAETHASYFSTHPERPQLAARCRRCALNRTSILINAHQQYLNLAETFIPVNTSTVAAKDPQVM